MKRRLHPADIAALALSLLAILAALMVHERVFERMAHLEDEMAYLWQAQVIADGRLTVESPPVPKSFLIPFIIDYNGLRFGKYPLGWPAVLALGEMVGLRFMVNPLLAGFGVWLTYILGKRIFGATVGLIAAGLTLTSPFFLMNSGSLLSHPLGLVCALGFVLGWLDAFTTPRHPRPWIPALAAAGALGLLAISRPFTAVVLALPFAPYGVYLLLRRTKEGEESPRPRLLTFGLVVLLIGGLHFLWQYAATGDPFLNLYTLWWPYDKIGFGPGHGLMKSGHTLHQAWINTRHSLRVGAGDLFGWAACSWIFLPLGLIPIWRERNWKALLPLSVFPGLFLLYMAYWIGSSLFGPRYWYEGLFSLTLLSAAGIAWLAGWPTRPDVPFPNYQDRRKGRSLGVTAVVALLLAANLIFYIPGRMKIMYGLYGVQRAHLEPFQTEQAQKMAPALIIVHTENGWIEYGALLELQDPFLDTPFIFVIARGAGADRQVSAAFPERNVYHYYPARAPFTFYKSAIPE